MLCIYTAVFICIKFLDVWTMSRSVDGLSNCFKYANEAGGAVLTKFICDYFVLPILWSVICIIYIIQLLCNKSANKAIYGSTIIAILAQVCFYIVSCNIVDREISVVWVLICIGFFLSFSMLFMDWTKGLLGKVLYVILGCSLLGIVIHMIMGYKTNMSTIVQYFENEGFWIKVVCILDSSVPLLGVIAMVLIMGYIVFPEKYFKREE